MTDVPTLEDLLERLKENDSISDAVLVSRSGMHIAGTVPKGAHTETFVAMSAILLGAAETSTSELKDTLKYVVIDLVKSRILLTGVSSRALLVMRTAQGSDTENILKTVSGYRKAIEDAL
ncbi:MAG: roadblock/LC7 domain-containing protein [Candidatus Thermoplasmatota archaeon]